MFNKSDDDKIAKDFNNTMFSAESLIGLASPVFASVESTSNSLFSM